ncbi:MAG: hypothetical protein O2783_04930 [Chloroflexi bacterium]|nr:hypothetical protein [Chloroflexota bacterium]
MRDTKALVVLSLLLLSFVGCSKTDETTSAMVLERAYAAAEEVTSFHFTLSYAATAEGIGELNAFEAEGSYLAPDRMWTIQMQGTDVAESIIIGNKIYRRDSESSRWGVPEDGPSPIWGLEAYLKEFMNASAESIVKLFSESKRVYRWCGVLDLQGRSHQNTG